MKTIPKKKVRLADPGVDVKSGKGAFYATLANGLAGAKNVEGQRRFFQSTIDVRTALKTKGRRMWDKLKHTTSFNRGNNIFTTGDLPSGVFFVEKGSVALVKSVKNAISIVNVVRENMLLGYRAYYAGRYQPVRYHETAKVLSPSAVVSEFSAADWQRITESEPKLLEHTLTSMAWEVGDMMKLLSWRVLPLRERIPIALLWLADQNGVVDMRRSEICRIFDVSQAQFCRHLTSLEGDKLIQRKRENVLVTPELRQRYRGMLVEG